MMWRSCVHHRGRTHNDSTMDFFQGISLMLSVCTFTHSAGVHGGASLLSGCPEKGHLVICGAIATYWFHLTQTSLSLLLACVLSSWSFLSRFPLSKYKICAFYVKTHFIKKLMRKQVWYFPKSFTVWHLYSSIFVASLLRVWSSSSSGAGQREESCFCTCIACSGWASFVSLSLGLWPQKPGGHLSSACGC